MVANAKNYPQQYEYYFTNSIVIFIVLHHCSEFSLFTRWNTLRQFCLPSSHLVQLQ